MSCIVCTCATLWRHRMMLQLPASGELGTALHDVMLAVLSNQVVCGKTSSTIVSTGWAQEVGYWDRFQAKALRGYGPGSLFIWDSRTVHQNCPPSDPTLWR